MFARSRLPIRLQNMTSAALACLAGMSAAVAGVKPAELVFSEGNILSASFDGRYLFLGAPFADGANQNQGRVLIFERAGAGVWNALDSIESPTPQPDGQFGYSLSVADGLLAVGARGVDPSGCVYVYRVGTDGGSPALVETLTPPGAGGANDFGLTVDVSAGWVVAGEQRVDSDGVFDSGSAYIFACDEKGCDAGQVLRPDMRTPGQNFGHAVSVYGDHALVGTLDEAMHAFERSGSQWIRSGTVLLGSDLAGPNVIDIQDERVVVGSPLRNAAGILRRAGSTWRQEYAYVDPSFDSLAGAAVALTPTLATFGAPFFPDNVAGEEGSAKVLERQAGQWSVLASLERDMPNIDIGSDQFGYAVAAHGNVVVVSKTSLRAYAYEFRPQLIHVSDFE